MENIDVSIVIVCMNNLKNLYPCLNSIKKYTNVSYETFVVAYLFSKENLQKVKQDFPWVTFIESNEIRGFAENNNLALKRAKGKYCFVVNDDTEMHMPVIDKLIEDFYGLSEKVAIISPKIVTPVGAISACGKRPVPFWLYVFGVFRLGNNIGKKFVNGVGLFKSYNIIGAAFIIKTAIFKRIGWFDETYFFCPEDVVVSETLNEMGYECWVDANIEITHYEGMSSKSTSLTQTATKPAALMGEIIHYTQDHKFKEIYVRPILGGIAFLQMIFHVLCFSLKKENYHKILALGYYNSFIASFSRKSPKDIFIKYYSSIKKK